MKLKFLRDLPKHLFKEIYETGVGQYYLTNLSAKVMLKVRSYKSTQRDKAKKIFINNEATPGVSLPNVQTFDVSLGKLDPLFMFFGIKRKEPAEISIVPYKLKPMNRFARHQIQRLAKCRDEGKTRKYFFLGGCLMKRSNVFRVMALNHVLPNGHRHHKLWWVLRNLRQLSILINKGLDNVVYKRHYIPKEENRGRKLGVPEVPGRLLTHMWSNLLTFYLQKFLSDHQHGFLPARGVITAGEDFFKQKMHTKPYIRKFDFKEFFDKVHVNRITEELFNLGFPPGVVYKLENFNRSLIQLQKEDKDDESDLRNREALIRMVSEGRIDPVHPVFDGIGDFVKSNGGEVLRESLGMFTVNGVSYSKYPTDKAQAEILINSDEGPPADINLGETLFEILQTQWAIMDYYKPAKVPNLLEGVPQGVNTSPILANVIADIWIKHVKKQGYLITMYADDSIVAGDKPCDLLIPEDTGITLNTYKSPYYKKAGVGVKPIHGLGCEFDGEHFSSRTRKGARITLQLKDKVLAYLFETLGPGYGVYTPEAALNFLDEIRKKEPEGERVSFDDDSANLFSGTNLFKSRLIGFIFSRIYSGKGNNEDLTQNFNNTFVNASGMDTKLNKGGSTLSIFNSSSFANLSLINMLRYLSRTKKPRIHFVTVKLRAKRHS